MHQRRECHYNVFLLLEKSRHVTAALRLKFNAIKSACSVWSYGDGARSAFTSLMIMLHWTLSHMWQATWCDISIYLDVTRSLIDEFLQVVRVEIVWGQHLEMCSQYFVDLKRTVHIRPNLSMKIVATGGGFSECSAFVFFVDSRPRHHMFLSPTRRFS